MTGAVKYHDGGPNDWSLSVPRAASMLGTGRSTIHVVDVGDIDIGEPTHLTRDGYPMTVLYAVAHGYAVWVDVGADG